jgi:hypothetical protein
MSISSSTNTATTSFSRKSTRSRISRRSSSSTSTFSNGCLIPRRRNALRVLQATRLPWNLPSPVSRLHALCVLVPHAEKEEEVKDKHQDYLEWFVLTVLMMAVAIFLGAVIGNADEIDKPEKGCVLQGCTLEGNPWFIFFVKVGNSEYNDQDDRPQILGYNPEDIHKDKEGKVILVTQLQERFIKAGRAGRIGHCLCHCPAW